MGSDMVVALGRATVDGDTLFGHNAEASESACCRLDFIAGRSFAPGEVVRTRSLEIPQVRQTNTVAGTRVGRGWGLENGINHQGVAAGCTCYRHKLHNEQPGLSGPELVRLVLERSHSASHGVDVLADLLERHGQGAFAGCPDADAADHAFLIADGREAYLIETAARHWVLQQILEVRAASNLSTIRQDWNRISPGLGQHAIGQGWWPGDGSKLDFAEALGTNPAGSASALRRWGRATLLLEQQNGHIDTGFLRRLLGDHYEGTHFEVDPFSSAAGPLTLCQHGQTGAATAASLIARLKPAADGMLVLECALGPPCLSVYFPLVLEAELPAALLRDGAEAMSLRCRLAHLVNHSRTDPELGHRMREQFAILQAGFDRGFEEWLANAGALRERGELGVLRQRSAAFMQRNLDAYEAVLVELLPRRPLAEWSAPVGSLR